MDDILCSCTALRHHLNANVPTLAQIAGDRRDAYRMFDCFNSRSLFADHADYVAYRNARTIAHAEIIVARA